MKLVSVIVPTYNRAGLLQQCIDSVCAQTYANIECIIIDDGSVDDTMKVIEEIQKTNDTVRVYKNARSKGAQGARNTGLEIAKGNYIQFLDSDDCIHPRKIELQVQALEEDNSLDMVYCLDEYFLENSNDNYILWNAPNSINDINRFLFDDLTFHTASPLWRSAALAKYKLNWDESLICWQDWDFHLKALIRGINYHYIPKVLNYIRDHDGFRSTSYRSLLKEKSKLIAAGNIFIELEQSGNLTKERRTYLKTFVFIILANIADADIKATDKKIIEAGYELLQKLNNQRVVCRMLYLVHRFSLIPLSEHLKITRRLLRIHSFPSNTWKQLPSIPFRMMA